MDEDAKGRLINGSNWGPKLFIAAVIGVAVFFWWLLVYSGGVSGHLG